MSEGVYVSKVEQFVFSIIEDYRRGDLSRKEVATILEVSEKTIQRRARAIRERGLLGIKHGNTGREPANKKSDELEKEVTSLVKEIYFDFNLCHALLRAYKAQYRAL